MSNLAHYGHHDLQTRFDALAQVAGREMARYVKPGVIPAVAVGFSAVGAAIEARFEEKGMMFNAGLAAAAWLGSMFAGDNADLRNGALAVATGLGSAAVAIGTHDWAIKNMGKATAVVPAPAPSV